MDSRNIQPDDHIFPKMEPIDVDFIKKEEIGEEKCFVVSGIVETLNDEKTLVKQEICEDEETGNSSSLNV